MIGPASANEKRALKTLWQACFHEEQPFLDWFFDERFLPAYCMRKTVGGDIVCAAHGLPLSARIRNATLPVVIPGGVATREDMRGRGYMREVFTAFLRALYGRGVAAVLYHPVDAAVYAGFLHYACADAQVITRVPDAMQPSMPDGAYICDMIAHADALYRCYHAFATRYSCCIARTRADFDGKLADYLAGGGRCLAVLRGEDILGYCMYFNEEDELYGDECVAPDDAAYARIYMAMRALSGGKTLRLRLPPDARISDAEAKSVTRPHSLIGAVSVPMLLAASGCRAHVPIRVTDDVLPENNGVFLPDGSRAREAPHIEMNAGRLAQWTCGYRSMAEIVAAGEATVYREDAPGLLDGIGKRACYLVEEY